MGNIVSFDPRAGSFETAQRLVRVLKTKRKASEKAGLFRMRDNKKGLKFKVKYWDYVIKEINKC